MKLVNIIYPSLLWTLLCFLFTPLSVFAGEGLSPDAVLKLEANIAGNPENKNSRRFLADHYGRQKNWAKVIQVLSPAVEKLPEKSLNLLLTAQQNKDDLSGSQVTAKALLGLDKLTLKSKIQVVDVWAQSLRNQGSADYGQREQKVNDTLSFLKQAHAEHPRSIKVYDLYLNFLEDFVDHFAFEGIRILDDLAKNRPLKARHYSQLCHYTSIAGYTKRALEACETAIGKDPKNFQNPIWLGKAHMFSGNKKKGNRVLASVGKKFKTSPEALLVTAEHYFGTKKFPLAYKYFALATALKDVEPEAYLGLAEVSMELKKYEMALKAYKQHCRLTRKLPQEFRRASGTLRNKPQLQQRFRSGMRTCNQ